MPTKPFWKSLTIWSIALLFLDSLSQRFFGVKLSDQAPLLSQAITALVTSAPPLVHAILQLVAVVAGIIGRFRAHDVKITLTNQNKDGGSLPPRGLQAALLFFALVPVTLMVTGCAGTLPSQFQNITPPLSATDTKFVQGLSDLDSPAALLGIRTGSGTIVSVAMYESIKQASTMTRDGKLLNGAGLELESITSGSLANMDAIDEILSGAQANTSTTQSVDNFGAIGQGLDGVIGAAKTYITNAAANAQNPQVGAYALTVFSDDLHAVGEGVCDVTGQYATTPLPPVSFHLPRADYHGLHLYASNP